MGILSKIKKKITGTVEKVKETVKKVAGKVVERAKTGGKIRETQRKVVEKAKAWSEKKKAEPVTMYSKEKGTFEMPAKEYAAKKEEVLAERAKHPVKETLKTAALVAGVIMPAAGMMKGLAGASRLNAISPAKTVQTTITGSKGFIVNTAINTKTTTIAGNIGKKVFSKKFIASAIIGGEAASLVLGLWGGAEAPEPVTYLGDDILTRASQTNSPEDWALYDEWETLADEFTNPSTIDKIITFSPVGVIANILKKAKGIKAGVVLRKKLAASIRESAETGEDIYAIGRREKEESEARIVDDFNKDAEIRQREKIEIDKIANAEEREAASAFWIEHEKKMLKLAADERQAMADFWMAYNKAAEKLRIDNSPSQLNFGLL